MFAVRQTRALWALSLALAFAGCKSAPPPESAVRTLPAAAPVRPTVAVPSFNVFHHDNSSVTLVTKANASDQEIEAILWELHDAAKAHSFDKLGIPQKLVDARDPIIWFHLYRGAKCASEKYTTGKLPCGASYHAAGDYTLGGFTDHNHDDAILLHSESDQTHLW